MADHLLIMASILRMCEIGPEQLDDLVHDATAPTASSINNQGMEAQLAYLFQCGWEVADVLSRLGIDPSAHQLPIEERSKEDSADRHGRLMGREIIHAFPFTGNRQRVLGELIKELASEMSPGEVRAAIRRGCPEALEPDTQWLTQEPEATP